MMCEVLFFNQRKVCLYTCDIHCQQMISNSIKLHSSFELGVYDFVFLFSPVFHLLLFRSPNTCTQKCLKDYFETIGILARELPYYPSTGCNHS